MATKLAKAPALTVDHNNYTDAYLRDILQREKARGQLVPVR